MSNVKESNVLREAQPERPPLPQNYDEKIKYDIIKLLKMDSAIPNFKDLESIFKHY